MISFFNRYSWHTKNRLLWAGALVFLLLSYQLAVKPTLRLRTEYKSLQDGEAARQANLALLNQLRAGANRTGHLFASSTAESDSALSEPERIAAVTQHHGAAMRSMPVPKRLGAETSLHLDYTEYQMEGNFSRLLQVLHDIERQQDLHVLSASFVKQPNPSTRAPELLLQVRTVRLADD